MESKAESLSDAYEALVTATMAVIEAHRECSGHRREPENEALEEFKRRWELFSAACDEAERVVETAKMRVELEHVANEHRDDCTAVTFLISLDGLEDAIADLKRA